MTGNEDTIYAASTAGLPAAIAIIRISGPKTRFVIETMAGSCPTPRFASYRTIRKPEDQSPIDRGLVLWFPGPDSFSGEDSGEFQVHGGPAVVAAMLEALSGIPGLRMAEPGEFTYRSFLNGKMDLTAVEGLADLISAETESQRRQALRQGEGRLGALYESWRKRIVKARAMIEAELDFADEEDVPGSVSTRIWPDLAALAEDIRLHLDSSGKARTLRSGISVVLQGRPNAGKSSLLNALSKRDAVIVSDEAGTTRDVVTVNMDLGGYLFSISDTAGIREAGSAIEAEGVRRALAAGETADLVIWLQGPDESDVTEAGVSRDDVPVWIVASKGDLIDSDTQRSFGSADLTLSAKTGAGLPELEAKLIEYAGTVCGTGMEDLATRGRHVEELRKSLLSLDTALAGDAMPIEVRAEDLRRASDALGRLTGRIDVEDLLDVIFSEFCVGK